MQITVQNTYYKANNTKIKQNYIIHNHIVSPHENIKLRSVKLTPQTSQFLKLGHLFNLTF